jgi:hypothetical protein
MNNKLQSWTSSIHIKLLIGDFESLVPTHLFSLVENDQSSDIGGSANVELLGGVTEWSAAWHERQLSFGLDWFFHKSTRIISARWATLRTNITVVDNAGADLGEDCLHLYVASMMKRVRWEEAVTASLNLSRVY